MTTLSFLRKWGIYIFVAVLVWLSVQDTIDKVRAYRTFFRTEGVIVYTEGEVISVQLWPSTRYFVEYYVNEQKVYANQSFLDLLHYGLKAGKKVIIFYNPENISEIEIYHKTFWLQSVFIITLFALLVLSDFKARTFKGPEIIPNDNDPKQKLLIRVILGASILIIISVLLFTWILIAKL